MVSRIENAKSDIFDKPTLEQLISGGYADLDVDRDTGRPKVAT